MAPQTRSHGNASSKPSESKPSESKTYKSTSAAPKQLLFPERQRNVKTYGKTSRRRPRAPKKQLKQGTLTQMDFISPSMPKDLLKSEDEEDEEDDNEEPELPAVKSKKRTRGSRRKTAGDELVKNENTRDTKRRKTLGDAPSSNPSSSFHTQTLTQLLSVKGENDNEDWQINDSEDDDTGFILETPKKVKVPAPSKANEPQSGIRSSVPSLVESVTPTNRRTKEVIPSSTSPITPMMMRYSPAPHKSPLVVKSANLTGPSPILKISKTPRERVIPDSYSTAHSSPTMQAHNSTIKATPVKKARFEFPEDKENITPGRTKPKTPKPLRKTPARPPLREREEVPDSDDDINGTGDVGDDEASTGDENAPAERNGDEIPSAGDPEEAAETCYGVIGEETQAEFLLAEEINRELEESDSAESSRSRSPTPTPNPKKIRVLPKAQVVNKSTPSPIFVAEKSPTSYLQKGQPDESPFKAQTQMSTQGLESQRLPLEVVHSLGPQTDNSDIMVSLHPEPLAKIINGTKNHEFRVWKIPPTVTRVWIYSTRPFSELKYMCTLGPPKVPGEIEDTKGVGNVEFNQGKAVAKYAYEILQVYELNDPVPLDEMKRKGWVNAAPQKYVWVPPAVIGELTANLKCALFGEDEEEQGAGAALVPSSPNVTESQELEAQLQDDAEFSTQHHSDHVNEVILSSQSTRRSSGRSKRTQPGGNQGFAKPAPPRLQSGSSTQSPPAPPSQRTHSAVRPSQATTVSSPALSPERLPPQVISIASDSSAANLHSSSPTAFRSARNNSLRSSQFLTRSQMLPDSLILDEVQEPPPIVYDSADELSDL
ncbi:hypothetical protein F5Y00DRAFT_234929 [Daldinia vernicosa]|uniref:uncharacterized protein n=1 Tax=Daldinia vernicosa TaxID=114800 RepID=UPI002008BB2B|nr:uncharacterized protein F5Y00DRAFT_234929 [Daldinia vernicosa]KAI0849823.1 hypothetical protein F5Y00DRAFT_234929 [Daldinia vernicosa]